MTWANKPVRHVRSVVCVGLSQNLNRFIVFNYVGGNFLVIMSVVIRRICGAHFANDSLG